jgi:hypothetical protein
MYNFQDVKNTEKKETSENYLSKDSKLMKMNNLDQKKVVKVNLKKLMNSPPNYEEMAEVIKVPSPKNSDHSESINYITIDDNLLKKIPQPPSNYRYDQSKYPNFLSRIPKIKA